MKVVEVFSSIQGEGINIGKRATFVRLSGCNMSPPCQYCDTKYALSAEAGEEIDNYDLEAQIFAVDPTPRLIIFTGGEPMLQEEEICDFVNTCYSTLKGIYIAMESNGTLTPRIINDYINHFHIAISPKLASACRDAYNLNILNQWVGCSRGDWTVEFKFVITSKLDVNEVHDIVKSLNLLQRNIPIIFQPDGFRDPYDLALREVLEWTEQDSYLKHQVRILPQLHRIMWGQKRGV